MIHEAVIFLLEIVRFILFLTITGFTIYFVYFITRHEQVTRIEKAILYFLVLTIGILLINGELLEDAPKQRRDKSSQTLQQQQSDLRMRAENRVYRRDAAHEFFNRERS